MHCRIVITTTIIALTNILFSQGRWGAELFIRQYGG